jgi:hypothetical protein
VSEQTRQAIEDAIRTHLADEGDADYPILTDWYLITANAGADAHSVNYTHVSSHSSLHVHMGLARIAVRRLDACHDLDLGD